MHSQPRLKLPAERLPKLGREKKDLWNINCKFRPILQINENEKQKQLVEKEIFNHYLHRLTRNHSISWISDTYFSGKFQYHVFKLIM